MPTLDAALLLSLNHLAHRSWTFDTLVLLVAEARLLKGAVLVALLCWSWGRVGARPTGPWVIRTVAGALAAVAAGRLLQNFLPERIRPLYDPAVAAAGFVPPHSVPPILRDWSSFPSDTSTMAFALATGVYLAHRRAGLIAYAWALLVVCLPRVYAGFHYPSDVAAGAAIGIAVMAAAARAPVPGRVLDALAHPAQAHRAWLYAGLFLLTYQLATMFEDARALARFAVYAASVAWHRL